MKKFIPLIIIFLVILALSYGSYVNAQSSGLDFAMRLFMGYFFLVFGAFKVIKLKAFATAYQKYDILAMRSRAYALIYPFLEISLGISYLANYMPTRTNILTIVLMSIGAIGVFKKLKQKEEIPCACLGTVFKLPMTWVTLFEDLLMVAMAIAMLSF